MMKKLFIVVMVFSFFMAYADWDHRQNNKITTFTVSWQGESYSKSHLQGQGGTNIFAQQNLSINKSVPSFVVSSNNKPNQPVQQKAVVHEQSQNNQLVYYLVAPDGRQEIVSKERFDTELKHVTDAYVQAAQTHFRVDMKELAPMINQAILQGTINSPETQNQLIHQAIIHAVTTGQTKAGVVNIYSDHPWVLKQDLSDTSLDDQIVINYAISRLYHCNNSRTIELAQGCLRAFEDAQQAQNESERVAYQKMSASCYATLLMNPNITPKIVEPNVDKLYNDVVDVYCNSKDSIDSIAAKVDSYHDVQLNEYSKKYLERLIDREDIFLKTLQNEEKFIKPTDFHFALSTDVIGYLMANNINYASFNNQECIFLQHLLTNQIVDLLEKNVGMASFNLNNYMLADFIKHTCSLAVSAQQLNQDYEIKQAITLADVSEFFTVIGQAVVDCIRETSIGVKVGSIKSLQSWITLAANLSSAPIETAGQGIQVVVDVALVCGHLVSAVAHSLPTMPTYNFDSMQYDTTNLEKLLEPPHLLDDLSKKYQSGKTGLSQAVEYSIPIVQSILQRPAQENVADVTQCIVDGLFIHGIGKALSYGATFAKMYLTGAAQTMAEVIAPHLMDESLHFATTSAGDVVACIDRTGEIISDVAQVAAAGMIDGTILAAKYIAQGKMLSDKVQELTNADKAKIAEFQKSIEPYLRCDKILNVERLKTIEGIEQINEFKKYTNNFTNLEKLTEQEILYLNLCDWLEPQAAKINARLKDIGGLKCIDPLSKAEAIIEKYDLFHSVLGEMTPGNLKKCISGGHLPLLELRTATLEIGEMKSFGNGFFDMNIRVRSNRKTNSYFPLGTSVEEVINMIEVGFENIKKFELSTSEGMTKAVLEVEGQCNQIFKLYIKNGEAKFFPFSPFNNEIL